MGSAEAPWRILEFYSGIGAMRYSLMRAGINGDVIEAFDINDTANDVYEHNFGHRPSQGNIQSLGDVELDKYGADAWLLSPPCQPYTRQGLQKHSADARAFSFIKIIELIQHMKQAPKLLFVENVVGFETSDTHEKMLEIMGILGFSTQEFILSSLQFGIPYSRPRYFCLAKRRPLSFQNPIFSNQLLRTPAPLITQETLLATNGYHLQDEFIPSKSVKNFLTTKTNCNSQLDGSCEEVEDIYVVPRSLIERWGSAMDIVYPDSNRCCCFTKSYYRYVKGTGSLLATSNISENHLTQKPEVESLLEMGLRYFTPREVANLHSFPEEFQFPKHITLRQQYALLGNSMSVAVVAPLLSYLFSKPTS